jgi:hypothetical protein
LYLEANAGPEPLKNHFRSLSLATEAPRRHATAQGVSPRQDRLPGQELSSGDALWHEIEGYHSEERIPASQ